MKAHETAAKLRHGFREDSPLHSHFEGMETALVSAHEHSRKDLGLFFIAARDDSHKHRRSTKEHQFFLGMAAGYAEAFVLKEFAGKREKVETAKLHTA